VQNCIEDTHVHAKTTLTCCAPACPDEFGFLCLLILELGASIAQRMQDLQCSLQGWTYNNGKKAYDIYTAKLIHLPVPPKT